MARNGSGVMSIPNPDFVSGTQIVSSETDDNNANIVAEITNSIAADGQTTITNNIPMSSKKFTTLNVGLNAGDSLNLGQAQAEAYVYCGVMTGTADAGILTVSPNVTAYAIGMRFVWIASANANTGPMTITVSGLPTIAAQDDGVALAAGDHAADKMYTGIMDTTSTIQIARQWNVTSEVFDKIDELTALTAPDVADTVAMYDDSASAAKKVTGSNFFKLVNGLTAYAAPLVTDVFYIYEAATGLAKRITGANLLEFIPGLSEDTTPSVTDLFVSTSGGTARHVTGANFLKIINGLTADTSTVSANDWFPLYDNSGSDAKKVHLPFTRSYTSPATTIAANGIVSLTHGLGKAPIMMQSSLICTSSDGNYDVGDQVFVNTSMADNTNDGICTYIPSSGSVPSATLIAVKIGLAGGPILPDEVAGTGFGIDVTKWKLIVSAWA